MSKPTEIHRRMIALLQSNPQGLTSGEIRAGLSLEAAEQAQLDRRRRDLYVWYEIAKEKKDGEWRYRFVSEREAPKHSGPVPAALRAQIKLAAHGRCQICGKTVERHGAVLVVDHKLPQDWGGTNDADNLWAICEECNAEKKNYYSAQDATLMRSVMQHKSVHVRIGETLKSLKSVPASLLALVANAADWPKRTRDLRYLGWNFSTSRRSLPSGKVEAVYQLTQFQDWPADPSREVRRIEQDRARAKKRRAAK